MPSRGRLFSLPPTIRCYCFAAAVATVSTSSQRILSAPVLNRRFKTSAQPIQARKEGVMQHGSLSSEQRKRSPDVGATDGGSRVQAAGGYTVESFSVRGSNCMTNERRTRRRRGYEGKSTRTPSARRRD